LGISGVDMSFITLFIMVSAASEADFSREFVLVVVLVVVLVPVVVPDLDLNFDDDIYIIIIYNYINE
jgi:hypothetical protein